MSPMPNVGGALWGMGDPRAFSIVRTAVVDFEAKQTVVDDGDFVGVMAPIPPQKLMIKPEGQRSWKWYTLQTDRRLENNDLIQDADGLTYKIISKSDWSSAGFYEYEAVEKSQ